MTPNGNPLDHPPSQDLGARAAREYVDGHQQDGEIAREPTKRLAPTEFDAAEEILAQLPTKAPTGRKTMSEVMEPYALIVQLVNIVVLFVIAIFFIWTFISVAEPSRALASIVVFSLFINIFLTIIVNANQIQARRPKIRLAKATVSKNRHGEYRLVFDILNQGGQSTALWIEESGIEIGTRYRTSLSIPDKNPSPILSGSGGIQPGERVRVHTVLNEPCLEAHRDKRIVLKVTPIAGFPVSRTLQWK